MAKYGVTNVAGGGGIGSDELSVTKEFVLSGKTYVGADTNDEIGVGAMENNGITANQSLNASGSFLVKKGYHAQGFTVAANNLAGQTSGTATAAQILSGQTAWVNGSKLTGTIASMGGQTINPTASQQIVSSSGKYLTGNVTVNGVSNLTAANVKRGVNVGGTVGTFEGYVPTATDLYLRGNNISEYAFVATGGGSGTAIFDAGQITLTGNSISIRPTKNTSFVGYNYLNIEGSSTMLSGREIRLHSDPASNTLVLTYTAPTVSSQPYTYSIDIKNAQVSGPLRIHFNNFNGVVFRIWLS